MLRWLVACDAILALVVICYAQNGRLRVLEKANISAYAVRRGGQHGRLKGVAYGVYHVSALRPPDLRHLRTTATLVYRVAIVSPRS